MKGLMVLGTASDVGKSIIQTVLCRYFVNKGYKVTPFKSQNMTNYLYETARGGIISQAQAIQAQAAKMTPTVEMNPIVLNMVGNGQAEVIIQGLKIKRVSGQAYRDEFYERGQAAISEALKKIENTYDLIIAEGAGSPVEINLKDKELVNMKIAEMADLPAILVADIDRGGVFASIVGTLSLLSPSERKRVKGIVINKFRGDRKMFESGIRWLEEKTGLPVLGVLPYVTHFIPREDSLSLANDGQVAESSVADIYDDIMHKLQPYFDFEKVEEIIRKWG